MSSSDYDSNSSRAGMVHVPWGMNGAWGRDPVPLVVRGMNGPWGRDAVPLVARGMNGAGGSRPQAPAASRNNARLLLSMMTSSAQMPQGNWIKAVICITTNQILFVETTPWLVELILEIIFLRAAEFGVNWAVGSDGVRVDGTRHIALQCAVTHELKQSMSHVPMRVLTYRGLELRRTVFTVRPHEWRVSCIGNSMPLYACENFSAEPGTGCPWYCTCTGSWCPGCGAPMGEWTFGRNAEMSWTPPLVLQENPRQVAARAVASRSFPFLSPAATQCFHGPFFRNNITFLVTDDLNFSFSPNKRMKQAVVGKILRAKGVRDARELRIQNFCIGHSRITKLIDAVLGNSLNVLSRAVDLMQNANDFFSGSVMFER